VQVSSESVADARGSSGDDVEVAAVAGEEVTGTLDLE
jgi:hypothetical protein